MMINDTLDIGQEVFVFLDKVIMKGTVLSDEDGSFKIRFDSIDGYTKTIYYWDIARTQHEVKEMVAERAVFWQNKLIDMLKESSNERT